MKKGRFSNSEMEFIEANAEVLSFNEIASQLDRDPTSVKEWIEKHPESVGLVSCLQFHGISINGPLQYKPIEFYQQCLEVNTLGCIRVIQAMLPLIRERKTPARGRIVVTGTGESRVLYI